MWKHILTLQADSSSQLSRGEPAVGSKGNSNVPETSGPPRDEFSSSLEPFDKQTKDAGLFEHVPIHTFSWKVSGGQAANYKDYGQTEMVRQSGAVYPFNSQEAVSRD